MTYSDNLKGRLLTYIVQVLGMREYRKNWYKGDCRLCGKKDKLGINLTDYRANCFYCGNHKNPIHYIMLSEGFQTYSEVYKFLRVFESTPYLEPKISVPEYKTPQLPEGFTPLAIGDSEIGKLARAYIKRRGLRVDKCTLRGIGYCVSGEFVGCIIFPYYQQGKLVYYQARKFIHLGGPKFKFPKEEDFGIGKSSTIYNIDALYIYQSVYLVESMFNSETMGDNGVAIGGKAISETQLSYIIKSPVEKVTLLLDPDAWVNALRLGLTLSDYKTTRVVKLPPKEDVNSLGKPKTLELIKSTPWQSYSDIYKLYLKS